MALLKSIPFENTGINATYWHIDYVEDRPYENLRLLNLQGWLNINAKNSNSGPVFNVRSKIDGSDYSRDMTYDQMYSVLKTQVITDESGNTINGLFFGAIDA